MTGNQRGWPYIGYEPIYRSPYGVVARESGWCSERKMGRFFNKVKDAFLKWSAASQYLQRKWIVVRGPGGERSKYSV